MTDHVWRALCMTFICFLIVAFIALFVYLGTESINATFAPATLGVTTVNTPITNT